jgi:peptidoglycan DL-endopeptidase LytE
MKFKLFFMLFFLALGVSAQENLTAGPGPLILEELTWRQLIVKTAREFVGVKYRFGGNSIAKGLDCSSFVQKIYAFYGMALPRSTREQIMQGQTIDRMEDLLPGDLIFFARKGTTPSHVGIYADKEKNTMIHNRRKKGIEETYLNRAYYRNRFIGGIRLWGFLNVSAEEKILPKNISDLDDSELEEDTI